MKRNIQFLIIGIVGLTIVSCSGKSDKTVETTAAEAMAEQKDTVENCLYSYDDSTSKIKFTAFKFLNRTGVGGEFTSFSITGNEPNEDPLAIIENLAFTIPVNTTFTKDPSRDDKIITFFYETIGVDTISGEVLSIDRATNKATVKITFNEISNDVIGDYTLEGAVFNFNAEIDVNNWEAEEGIKALNDECKALHIGPGDTESKLWSEVAIAFSTTLKKECE